MRRPEKCIHCSSSRCAVPPGATQNPRKLWRSLPKSWVFIDHTIPWLTLLSRSYFNYVIGFSQAAFLPCFATTLLKKVSEKVFVECYSLLHCLPPILKEEVGLGCHTNIWLFTPEFGMEFFWTSIHRHPFGEAIPAQCPRCGTLRRPKASLLGKRTYRLTCMSKCGWKETHKVQWGPEWRLDRVDDNSWGQRLVYGEWENVESMNKAPRREF